MEQREINGVARSVVKLLNKRQKGNVEDYLFTKKKQLLANVFIYVNEDGLG